MNIRRFPIALALVLGGLVAIVAWAQSSEEAVLIDQAVDQDVYAASREVSVQSSVTGDFVAAAQRVTVDGTVAGDIIVAAQTIDISLQYKTTCAQSGRLFKSLHRSPATLWQPATA